MIAAAKQQGLAATAARTKALLLLLAHVAVAVAPLSHGWQPPPAAAPPHRDPSPPSAAQLAAGGGPPRRPLVIAHRGASGPLPEHTRPAYALAIASGADFIECDVQLTLDLEMVCRHEQRLDATSDAAERFPRRVKTHVIDGEASTGVHAADLTLGELRTLRARQRFPSRDQSHNGR